MERYPGLAALPRASFVTAPTPVVPSAVGDQLWIKRDDLSGHLLGGNKVRALEFLLGAVAPGDEVITFGAHGSTHALATALHASHLGAHATVFRWPQEMHDTARLVDAAIRRAAGVRDSRTVAGAYVRAALYRLGWGRSGDGVGTESGRSGDGVGTESGRTPATHWIPAGGTSPLGILGHVDAALELAAQVGAGELPTPARVVVPFGSGGTAAGLRIGFGLAGLPATVVGVQVVPRIVANLRRWDRLVARTVAFIEHHTGRRIGNLPGIHRMDRQFYGGAYGRETDATRDAARRYRAEHPDAMLDATYSAKAYAAALVACDGLPTVFWQTFDARPFLG